MKFEAVFAAGSFSQNSMIFVLIFVSFVKYAETSPPENRLMQDLMQGYCAEERPVIDSSQPVVVKLGITIQQIIDLNEREQQLELNMWLRYHWRDENLRWDPEQYENVTDLRHPIDQIWTPDILLYNSVDTEFDSTYKVNLLGYSDGTINWIPPGIFKVSCQIDITYFPFTDHTCMLKFGSWSFSGRQIDLQPGDFDFSEYMENGEWVVVNYWVNRSEKFYACCPEPYPDIKFFIQLRRRTLYHAFNLLTPCALIMILVMLGFTMSPETSEKVGLQISVSLAISIFLTFVMEVTPKTSDALPLLGIFFQSCFIISLGATAFTVYVQSIHFRNQKNHRRMGFWTRYFLLEWIPYLLCVKRPRRQTTFTSLVKNFEDRKIPSKEIRTTAFTYEDGTCTIINSRGDCIKDNYESIMIQIQDMAKEKSENFVVERLKMLENIYKHIKKMREASEKTVNEKKIRSEWMFAAIIVDRLGLIIFLILLGTTTALILTKAPYLVA